MCKIENLIYNAINDYTNIKGLKIRYSDWTTVKYFEIKSLDMTNRTVLGSYDDGEVAEFRLDSDFWELYNPLCEYPPRAV